MANRKVSAAVKKSANGDTNAKGFCRRRHPVIAAFTFIIVIAVAFGALAAVAKMQSNEITYLRSQVERLQFESRD